MKSKIIYLIWAMVSFIFIGCSEKLYNIGYDSNPRGATLNCNGINYGYTPIFWRVNEEKLNYILDNNILTNCELIWVSGAKTPTEDFTREVIAPFPEGAGQTQNRPEYPNLDKDIQFASQLEQQRQQQALVEQQQAMIRQQVAEQQKQELSAKIKETNRQIMEQNRRQQESFDRAYNYFKETDQENYRNQMLHQMNKLNNNLNYMNYNLNRF